MDARNSQFLQRTATNSSGSLQLKSPVSIEAGDFGLYTLALLGLMGVLRLPWHLSAWRSCGVLACDSDLVRQGRGLPYKTVLVKDFGSARQGFLVQTGFGGGLVWHSRGPGTEGVSVPSNDGRAISCVWDLPGTTLSPPVSSAERLLVCSRSRRTRRPRAGLTICNGWSAARPRSRTTQRGEMPTSISCRSGIRL